MADSPVFEWACATLEEGTSLTRIQARGTMRIVVNGAGLDSQSLKVAALQVLARRVLPKELERRALQDVEAVCARIASCPQSIEGQMEVDSDEPVDVFKRLGRRA